MANERRRLTTKKILIASIGVATLSYATLGCEKQYPTGNLMPPRDYDAPRVTPDDAAAPLDAGAATVATPDTSTGTGTDAGTGKTVDAGAVRLVPRPEIVTSGNLMPPPPQPPPDAGARGRKR